jgi:hypothetical protein
MLTGAFQCWNNRITAWGAAKLGTALEHNSCLQSLDLSANEISAGSETNSLMHSMRSNTTLTDLDLSSNVCHFATEKPVRDIMDKNQSIYTQRNSDMHAFVSNMGATIQSKLGRLQVRALEPETRNPKPKNPQASQLQASHHRPCNHHRMQTHSPGEVWRSHALVPHSPPRRRLMPPHGAQTCYTLRAMIPLPPPCSHMRARSWASVAQAVRHHSAEIMDPKP